MIDSILKAIGIIIFILALTISAITLLFLIDLFIILPLIFFKII